VGRVSTYLQVSADGYFAGPNGEMDFFKDAEPDPEFEAFSLERARDDSTLLFGRTLGSGSLVQQLTRLGLVGLTYRRC
jgi:hypothetical protein